MNKCFHIVVVLTLVSVAYGADWPQWRGPARNGIAAGEPTPATWPEDGPTVVWKAPIFRAKQNGGLGNPVIADGRVFLFISPQTEEPLQTRSFPVDALRATGWFDEKIPADVFAKVEATREDEELKKLKGGERGPWIQKWVAANLSPEQEKQLGRAVRDRLQRGDAAPSIETVAALGQLKDKTFETQAALDEWLAANKLTGPAAAAVNKAAVKIKKHQTDLMLAFDAQSGKELWQREYPGKAHQWGLSPTPAVADGRVYVMGSHGDAYCFSAADGKEIWKQRLDDGSSASFIVADGLAVVPGRTLTAMDAATGEIKWRAEKIKTDSASPVLWRSGGIAYLLCNSPGAVYCVELATGKVMWQTPGGLFSTVAVEGDVMAVLTNNAETGLSAYRISPEKAERLWKSDMVDRGSSPIIANDHVYAYAKGKVRCVKLADGSTVWEQNLGNGEITPLVLVGERLLAIAGGGRLAMLDASPANNGEVLVKAKVELPVCTSPTIANGRMYLRAETALVCYDLGAAK